MRREKRERLVAPIVAEARWTVLLVEGKDRQQLDRIDAEIPQVGDLVDQPGVATARARSDARTWMPGKPADVHLVDDRLGERPTEGYVALPVIGARIDDHALRCSRSVVAGFSARPPGCLTPAGRRTSRKDRAEPCSRRNAALSPGRTGPRHGRRRADPR